MPHKHQQGQQFNPRYIVEPSAIHLGCEGLTVHFNTHIHHKHKNTTSIITFILSQRKHNNNLSGHMVGFNSSYGVAQMVTLDVFGQVGDYLYACQEK